jgi:hypothetical protein
MEKRKEFLKRKDLCFAIEQIENNFLFGDNLTDNFKSEDESK